MKDKTCCFIGPGGSYNEDQRLYLKNQMLTYALDAISDGYTRFICGLGKGSDFLFATTVIRQMEQHPDITLEVALTHREQLYSHNGALHFLLRASSKAYVVSERYSTYAKEKRNRFLIDQSGRGIFLFSDSTAKYNMVSKAREYAGKKKIQLHLIPPPERIMADMAE